MSDRKVYFRVRPMGRMLHIPTRLLVLITLLLVVVFASVLDAIPSGPSNPALGFLGGAGIVGFVTGIVAILSALFARHWGWAAGLALATPVGALGAIIAGGGFLPSPPTVAYPLVTLYILLTPLTALVHESQMAMRKPPVS